jgi:hypothetical protein
MTAEVEPQKRKVRIEIAKGGECRGGEIYKIVSALWDMQEER